jgi:hypothetical protein
MLGPLVFCQQLKASVPIKEPQRDPKAMNTLQSSMNAMGGVEAWESIRSTRRSGQYALDSTDAGHAFTWTDDWSTSVFRFRRDSEKSGSASAYIQRSPTATGSAAGSSKYLPPPLDPVDSSIAHIPAVAILRVINDKSYGLSVIESPEPLVASNCVEVTHLTSPYVKAIWCFSSQSLPVFAVISIANLAHSGTPLSKKITYVSFSPYAGITMPSVVEIAYPWGKTARYTFSGFEINPSIPSNTFSKGQQ